MTDYNSTINLPKTDFPMRASLPQREPDMLKRWQDEKVYETLLTLNEGKPAYILHDGPPFSNGYIHMGTAMNKVLKDFVNRQKMMSGYYVSYVPGWDNHGMPIESAIIKKQRIDRKTLPIPEFRDACKAFAEDFVKIQMDQFVRLGVLGDWEHPYLTMAPEFEAEEVRVFGTMYEKGYIYKGLKPVYWCPDCETALAEAEIEYEEDPCKSIYVKFPLKDDKGKLAQYGPVDRMSFVIWTTTTWTIPGNLAIALNPNESYALCRTENGEILIVAEALAEKNMKLAGLSYTVVATLPGSEFEYMAARHPLYERDSLIVQADYVTMDSGTGCVHTAPGLGLDDYMTGKRYGLEILVHVDDKGRMNERAGQFAGLDYEAANKAIFKELLEGGFLFAQENISHTYPHCWRCKQPVLYRATDQWFCNVDAFKEEAVKAAQAVEWIPKWGEERMISMLRDRSDWCISRQRHWGLPIPVFYCEECGGTVCDKTTIEAVAQLFKAKGSNAWYTDPAGEILPDGYVCPHCGGKHFTKETDTLDGWFDSGSSHFASLKLHHPEQWPCDMYLEGADQYRGWFQSSLLVAVGVEGGGAPYKTVMTHGWTVDGEGKAMHKSLGNTVDPLDIIKVYGADILRLWVASSDYHADVRVSADIFKQLSQAYLKIRNTMRYILGNLEGLDPDALVSPEEMQPLDRWAITRLNELIERVNAAYREFEYHIVYHALYDFCVVDMSNFYLDVIKDRLYCEAPTGTARRSAQTAIYLILDAMTRMLAPILAFTADEVWLSMPHASGHDSRNVMYNGEASPHAEYALDQEEMRRWEELIKLRDDVNFELENKRAQKLFGKPLEACVTLFVRDESRREELTGMIELLKALFIVSEVRIVPGEGGQPCRTVEGVGVLAERAEGEKCVRCWCYSDTVGKDEAHPALCARCADVVETL